MLINHSINIKKWDDHTFPAEETTFAFLGVGDEGDFHTQLCCLLSGSKWCSQVSPAVITFEISYGSSCTIIFNCMQTCMQTSFRSGISSLGTHRAQTRLIFNFLSPPCEWNPVKFSRFQKVILRSFFDPLWLWQQQCCCFLKSSNWGAGSTFLWNWLSPLFKQFIPSLSLLEHCIGLSWRFVETKAEFQGGILFVARHFHCSHRHYWTWLAHDSQAGTWNFHQECMMHSAKKYRKEKI